MSKENVKSFFAELEKNHSLSLKYLEAMNEYHQDVNELFAAKLAELGNSVGFDFNGKDIKELRTELNVIHGELDDSVLGKVAGGRLAPQYLGLEGTPLP